MIPPIPSIPPWTKTRPNPPPRPTAALVIAGPETVALGIAALETGVRATVEQATVGPGTGARATVEQATVALETGEPATVAVAGRRTRVNAGRY